MIYNRNNGTILTSYAANTPTVRGTWQLGWGLELVAFDMASRRPFLGFFYSGIILEMF